MARSYSPQRYSVSFGPGPMSLTMQVLIGANVALFLAQTLAPGITQYLGLVPYNVIHRFMGWQLATYMFLHGGIIHLLFNMLALWMIGTDLERMWGSRRFVRYYLVCGIGAGILTVLFSLLPLDVAASLQGSIVIGASGAIYGLLLAYGMYFPDRELWVFMLFPMRARYYVILMGAMAFYFALTDNGGVANATHLGGLLVGYLMLKGGRVDPLSELKYWYLRWKMQRVRKKFDVYQGGRSGSGWNDRVH